MSATHAAPTVAGAPAAAHVPAEPVVSVERVSKWFGGVVAVSDVSFGIGAGVTSLLGPNGAGKSTLLRLMAGLAAPDGGQVRIMGRDPRRDTSVLERVGVVPQQEGVFPGLDALGFVTMAARLCGVGRPEERAATTLGIVDLDPADRRSVETYSKGMKQRVKVAQALVGDPTVIMADEPLNGLDPRQRRGLISLFHSLGASGRCIIVSSHVLDEVQQIGSRVLVIAQGRLAAEGDFRAIRDLMDDRPHLIRIRADDVRRLGASLVQDPSVAGVHLVADDTIEVEVSDVVGFRRLLAPASRAVDAPLREVVPLDDDLESVFRYLVSSTGPRSS